MSAKSSPAPSFFPASTSSYFWSNRVKEFKKAKRGIAAESPDATMDFHAEWRKNNCLHEYCHGGAYCLAGHPIHGMAGRNSLGVAVWWFDLGNFLW